MQQGSEWFPYSSIICAHKLAVTVWPWVALCLCPSSAQWWRGWLFCHSHPWDSQSHRASALSLHLHTPPLFLWFAVLNVGDITGKTHTAQSEGSVHPLWFCQLSCCILLVYWTIHCTPETGCVWVCLCNVRPSSSVTRSHPSPFFHAVCGTKWKQHTGGWSTVVTLRKHCLKQGLSNTILLSCDDNFQMYRLFPGSCSRGGTEIMMIGSSSGTFSSTTSS